jgi:hypothetical protein
MMPGTLPYIAMEILGKSWNSTGHIYCHGNPYENHITVNPYGGLRII